MADEIFPVRIEGKIELSDGTVNQFSIESDSGWHQWENTTEKLGASVDLLDELSAAAMEHLHEPKED